MSRAPCRLRPGTQCRPICSHERSRESECGFARHPHSPGRNVVIARRATGQVAGGANLICFTSGRGSAYGCAPSPSLKLSTHTALRLKQQDDIDIDCGGIVEGLDTVDAVGERICQLMLATASGRSTKSEMHGYGQNEFVPWQLGAVM